jgi:hypothetical protein
VARLLMLLNFPESNFALSKYYEKKDCKELLRKLIENALRSKDDKRKIHHQPLRSENLGTKIVFKRRTFSSWDKLKVQKRPF